MSDQLMHALLDRAKQPAPIHDSVERTAIPADGPAPIPIAPIQTGPEVKSVNPYLTSLMGGLADTASTYAFLKRGTATEDNALAGSLPNSPGKFAAVGAGLNIAVPLLLKQLAKKYPKLAETVAANQGALQMGYGAINTQNTLNHTKTPSPYQEGRNTANMYRDALLSQLSPSRIK